MKRIPIAILASCLLSVAAWAQAPKPQESKPAAQPESPPQYKPPLRGAVASTKRVSGGTRGWGDVELPALVVVAPEHPGLTLKASPTLYWYLSQPTPIPLVLTLIEENAVKPALEVPLQAPQRPGLQRVELARHGVTLKPDTEYEWSVALVVDPGERSRDVIAQGVVLRRPASAELDARLKSLSAQQAPFFYAEEGLFYDAFQALSDSIDADPASPALRARRRALLEQIGLPEVATLDR